MDKGMRVRLKGCWESKRVWMEGAPLTAADSQALINHSPDGFNWGYGGSGPAQLSLAIALKLWGKEIAMANYHKVMLEVSNLPKASFELEILI